MPPHAVSFEAAPETAPDGLASHLADCARSRGRVHGLRGIAEILHARLASRFVSMLTVLMLLTSLVWWAD